MFNFLKKKKNVEEIQLTEDTRAEINKEDGVVKVVKDKELLSKDNIGLLETFSKQNDIPIFKGAVEHAYESDFLGYTHTCPKCETPTQQMMSNYGYATQESARILAGPIGHFCPNCPTVIIDDDLMRKVVDPKYIYGGVFSIETGFEEKTPVFATLNGEKVVFILSTEDPNDLSNADIGGIAQSVHQTHGPDDLYHVSNSAYHGFDEVRNEQKRIANQKKKSQTKKKNKAAKLARKRNRRR